RRLRGRTSPKTSRPPPRSSTGSARSRRRQKSGSKRHSSSSPKAFARKRTSSCGRRSSSTARWTRRITCASARLSSPRRPSSGSRADARELFDGGESGGDLQHAVVPHRLHARGDRSTLDLFATRLGGRELLELLAHRQQ